MYFVNGLPKIVATIPLEEDEAFQYLCCNRERIFILILRKVSLSIWQLKPLVQLTAYRRSEMSVRNLGINVSALWKPDSSAIVVQTSDGGLIFFNIDTKSADTECYMLEDAKNSKRESDELFIKEAVPYISIVPTASILVTGGITCLESLRDNVMVASTSGLIQRIQWDGSVNDALTIVLDSVPFSVDFPQSKKSYLSSSSVHVVDLDYSFLLGGFSLVLSNGRGALMTASHFEFLPAAVQCVWVPSEPCAFTCTAVNHKYRLMAFGCANAQGAMYCIEDQTEGIQLTHRLQLLDKDCPDMMAACGSVEDLNWTPDGSALALIWKKGGFAIWSVFGALITFCLSLVHEGVPRSVTALDWGTEGYTLWITDPKVVFIYNFIKSALAVNNCSTNRMYVLLQGENNILLNTGDRVIPHPHGSSGTADQHKLFSNKAWTVIQLPYRYMGTNWPLRYTVVDCEGESIAVAGRHALAFYNISNRKWKTFNNDAAEQLFIVTGGLLWWRDFIISGCSNTKTKQNEVRFYSKTKTLDHSNASVWKSQAPVISLNAFRDMLIVFSSDSLLTLCGMERKAGDVPAVIIHVLQIVSIENISPHPHCVVSVDLTPVRTETGQRKHTGIREAESLLINVSGRLWIIQRDASDPNKETYSDESVVTTSNVTPLLLSSCVEMLWVHPSVTPSKEKPQLCEALWMFCGAHGMKVWMPLFTKDGTRRNTFLSRRVMLPVWLKSVPLCVLFDEAMIHGAESDFLYDSGLIEKEADQLPAFVVNRTSEVYLPQVLRQLLRKNLGAHALEIAQTCTKLPYFNHSLELLLHQVLEEEGTSSAPIPDPLLPSVVAFVQEFPVSLQTIAHCARKSDIALWPRLFAEAGEPTDLFQECLSANRLDIAASFLIVLNGSLGASVVKKQANALLERARSTSSTSNSDLVAETERFLHALEMEEMEGYRRTPELTSGSVKSPGPLQHPSPENMDLGNPISPQGTLTFKYGPVVRSKTASESAQGRQLALKRASSVPFGDAGVGSARSMSVVAPPSLAELQLVGNGGMVQSATVSGGLGGLEGLGGLYSAAAGYDRMDSGSFSGFPGSAQKNSSGTSVTSRNGWSRRRFPGHAVLKDVQPFS